MSKKVTVTAKTVAEAVKSALSQLQSSEEQVNIRVIEEPSKGFFGLGAKLAKVEVELKEVDSVASPLDDISTPSKDIDTPLEEDTQRDFGQVTSIEADEQEAIDQAKKFLKEVIQKMQADADIQVSKREQNYLFQLQGQKLGMLIGRRGQTLDSLQYLTNLVANRYSDSYIRITLDAENYRAKRKEALEQLADRMAKKVIRSRSKIKLEPMNAAERKIIHTHLQRYAGVETESYGEDPNRYIVIMPK